MWSIFGLSPEAFVASYTKNDDEHDYKPHFYIIDFQKKGTLYNEEEQMKSSQAPSAALTLKNENSGEIIGIVTFGDALESRTVFIAEQFYRTFRTSLSKILSF
ncbi:MAG: hypothetical protein GY782_06355 [Gammaproteobacteria bacterium]|nr:hypothetical protein [Gammaproteobacteria bacterium]